MEKCYHGIIILIDLSKREIEKIKLHDSIYRNFIGGAGLGSRLLYEYMKPHEDPLGNGNYLGFFPGLLNGTEVPMSAKYTVVTKSPLTNTWADSNSGGYWGPELKLAGYDGVLITGKANRPVYIYIQNEKVELKNAEHLWGKDTVETEDIIKNELKEDKAKVACIGPAGEKQSLCACIINEKRVAARQGVGAVMGSKLLKAIVVRGNGKIKSSDEDNMTLLRKEWLFELSNPSAPFLKTLKNCGTSGGVVNLLPIGATPIKNWKQIGEKHFPGYKKLSEEKASKYLMRKYGCSKCPLACGGIVQIKKGEYKVEETRRPEYETLASFGPLCLNDNLESIIYANDICDRYGIDTISTGTTIAFAMECYEKGLIGKKETDGIELTWGNHKSMIQLLKMIVKREGIGDLLADGVKNAAKRIGKDSKNFSIHIEGQEPGCHDPRLIDYRGLGYISAPRPGRHMISSPSARLELEGSLGPYKELKSNKKMLKGEIHSVGNSYSQMFSDSGMCLFALDGGSDVKFVEFMKAATGWDFTIEEAIETGKRIQTMKQLFNISEGRKVSNWVLPERLLPPAKTGPFANKQIDYEKMKVEYYEAMKWEITNGKPTMECLEELKLKDIVQFRKI